MKVQNENTDAEVLFRAVLQLSTIVQQTIESDPKSTHIAMLNELAPILLTVQNALTVLIHHDRGYLLILGWYQQCGVQSPHDVYFIQKLLEKMMADHKRMEAIVTTFIRYATVQIGLGILLMTAPTGLFLMYLTVLMANPVALVTVLALAGIVLPLLGNTLINQGVKNRDEAQLVREVSMLGTPLGLPHKQRLDVFFKQPALVKLNAELSKAMDQVSAVQAEA